MFIFKSSPVFLKWFNELRDRTAKMRITARIERAKNGNLGDYKSVGDGVYEMRIDYGQGYRIYYAQQDGITYLLLSGSARKLDQQSDIKSAKAMWQALKQEMNNAF